MDIKGEIDTSRLLSKSGTEGQILVIKSKKLINTQENGKS